MIDRTVVPDKLERVLRSARERDFPIHLQHLSVDYVTELRYIDKRRIHNLKYYTWVEQQGKTHDEIMDPWYSPEYWTEIQGQIEDIDRLRILASNQGSSGSCSPKGLTAGQPPNFRIQGC